MRIVPLQFEVQHKRGRLRRSVLLCYCSIEEGHYGVQKEEAEENAKTTVETLKKTANLFDKKQRTKLINALKQEMSECAERLEYEQAAALRDQIKEIEVQYGK